MWDTNSSFAPSLMYLLRCIIRKTISNINITAVFISIIVLMVCFSAQILSQKSQNSNKELLPIFYKSILISYIFCILLSTVFFRQGKIDISSRVLANPIALYRGAFSDMSCLSEIILNIVLFFPIGFVVRRVSHQNGNFRKRLLIIGMMISLSIETLQVITGKGYFEVADIINNTIGCVLGGLFSSKTSNTIEGD